MTEAEQLALVDTERLIEASGAPRSVVYRATKAGRLPTRGLNGPKIREALGRIFAAPAPSPTPARGPGLVEHRIATDTSTPARALRGLDIGVCIHGITDGGWSVMDAIEHLAELAAPVDLAISTWTSTLRDVRRLGRLVESKHVRSIRFLADRSMPSREPKVMALIRETLGDDVIRIWNCHAKFSLIRGPRLALVYLTSANMNMNKRLEDFTVMEGAEPIGKYVELVERLYAKQHVGEVLADPPLARLHTTAVFEAAHPGSTTADRPDTPAAPPGPGAGATDLDRKRAKEVELLQEQIKKATRENDLASRSIVARENVEAALRRAASEYRRGAETLRRDLAGTCDAGTLARLDAGLEALRLRLAEALEVGG